MPLTGAMTGNTCYADIPTALDAYFSAIAPVTLANGNFISYQKLTGVWNHVESNGAWFMAQPALLPSLAPCDPYAAWNDGLVFGSLLLIAIVAAVTFGIVSKAKS